jgi:hypothetical protein
VTTAEGFADAYHQFRDSGWVGLRAPQDVGGQGLPALVAMATEEMWCSANLSFSLAPLLTLGAHVLRGAQAHPAAVAELVVGVGKAFGGGHLVVFPGVALVAVVVAATLSQLHSWLTNR